MRLWLPLAPLMSFFQCVQYKQFCFWREVTVAMPAKPLLERWSESWCMFGQLSDFSQAKRGFWKEQSTNITWLWLLKNEKRKYKVIYQLMQLVCYVWAHTYGSYIFLLYSLNVLSAYALVLSIFCWWASSPDYVFCFCSSLILCSC